MGLSVHGSSAVPMSLLPWRQAAPSPSVRGNAVPRVFWSRSSGSTGFALYGHCTGSQVVRVTGTKRSRTVNPIPRTLPPCSCPRGCVEFCPISAVRISPVIQRRVGFGLRDDSDILREEIPFLSIFYTKTPCRHAHEVSRPWIHRPRAIVGLNPRDRRGRTACKTLEQLEKQE